MPKYYTAEQVADLMAVSTATVYKAVAEGELRGSLLSPHNLRIEESAVDAWMDLKTAPSRSRKPERPAPAATPAVDWPDRDLYANKTAPTAAQGQPAPVCRAKRLDSITPEQLGALIVTQHQGIVDWLRMRGFTGPSVDRAKPGDVFGRTVIGILPIDLAALTNEMLFVRLPSLSGRRWGDLTATDLEQLGAYLLHVKVEHIGKIID
jgi:excisionase family DNA binding protein